MRFGDDVVDVGLQAFKSEMDLPPVVKLQCYHKCCKHMHDEEHDVESQAGSKLKRRRQNECHMNIT